VKKYTILLFQPYLRVHILNFAHGLKRFEYRLERVSHHSSSRTFYKSAAASVELEFARDKVTRLTKTRRILGILNVRIKFTRKADMLFTYGCLLITNKPYCVYIENGVTLFNYDATIARNPIARVLLAYLIRLPQCKKLIFMSETAYKSFLATLRPSQATCHIIEKKSVTIYPLVIDPNAVQPKQFGNKLHLLFTGVFYMKGGIETLNAFDRVREKHSNVTLTIITPIHLLRLQDKERMTTTPGITLRDATLSKQEMEEAYRHHDIFLFPTFRDTFGLVVIEAMAFGLPTIAVDQYAVHEMVENNSNGFLYPDHPITDYNRKTLEMYGNLYNAKDFYQALFDAQKSGEMTQIEDFLVESITHYLRDKELLKKHSVNSIELYQKQFSQKVISQKIEAAFLDAVSEKK
jgi:glycosyltransferase involved in cell wall biosynthesis